MEKHQSVHVPVNLDSSTQFVQFKYKEYEYLLVKSRNAFNLTNLNNKSSHKWMGVYNNHIHPNMPSIFYWEDHSVSITGASLDGIRHYVDNKQCMSLDNDKFYNLIPGGFGQNVTGVIFYNDYVIIVENEYEHKLLKTNYAKNLENIFY